MEFVRSIKTVTGEIVGSLEEAQQIEIASILRSALDPNNPEAGKASAAVLVKNKEAVLKILGLTGKTRGPRKKTTIPTLTTNETALKPTATETPPAQEKRQAYLQPGGTYRPV